MPLLFKPDKIVLNLILHVGEESTKQNLAVTETDIKMTEKGPLSAGQSETEHEDQTQGLSVIKNVELHSPSVSDDEDAYGAQVRQIKN